MSASPSPAARLSGLTRVGQVNLTEADVPLVDVDFWLDVWTRARLEAVLLNCGGIMAYHPTRLEGHPVAAGVDRRDVFGELVAAARGAGIQVVGRLDVGVVDQRFRDLHPDWMMTDEHGRSRTLNDVTGGTWGEPGGHRLENQMYYSCINSGLFDDYLPRLLTEVAEGYDVAGFFTNGFPTVALATPSLRMACHCDACRRLWAEASGQEAYPAADDPDDPVFRRYVRFLQETSLTRLRDLQAYTRSLGEGMTFITSATPTLRGGLPWREWADELDLVFCDNQDRSGNYGRLAPSHALWEVGLSSEILRSVAEATPTLRIQATYRFRGGGRHTAKEPAELRLQMAQALAHGELPVWHAVSARQYRRSWIDGVVALDAWVAEHAQVFRDRRPVADIGVLWSQASSWLADWGCAHPGPEHGDAVSGWYLALLRNRVPTQLVNADSGESWDDLRTLVLPSGLSLSVEAVDRVSAFVARGGSLVVVGTAGMLDEWGRPHEGDPVGRAAGVRREPPAPDGFDLVSYLRLGDDPFAHTLLPGFEPDEVVTGGSWVTRFETDNPTSLEWTRSEHMIPTHAAGLPAGSGRSVLATSSTGGSRTAYLATDLDAQFFVHRTVDHRTLLGNLARWTLEPTGPLVTVEGGGYVDVRCWETPGGPVVVLVNLDNAGTNDEPVESFRPLGPFTVTVHVAATSVRLLRADVEAALEHTPDGVRFVVPTVEDLEVATLTTG
ncbi:beta-galactosidase trimerization domain-containing protein [Phycicoccus sp. BSK3Z-2]|uniref:Beta-galactosidase trimerization domain-containing protein n=1 Tax=Phycicoccus avicenniae TaxID=2828860 RepID=A0A941HYY3_9MICO|nr:beta-galactosidase trimerization domain-containing protein [Phycicoccus avicenniae]MBR7741681.1 beta-galactosidase trimerization domain-containing protein [Phycicoccus avicenniae]